VTAPANRRALVPLWARLVVAVGIAAPLGTVLLGRPYDIARDALAIGTCAAVGSLALDLDLRRPRLGQALVVGLAFGLATFFALPNLSALSVPYATAAALGGLVRALGRRQARPALRALAAALACFVFFGGTIALLRGIRSFRELVPEEFVVGAVFGAAAAVSLAASGWRDSGPSDRD
jgi:uncharacterized YccA/Bax inhibitor family protein